MRSWRKGSAVTAEDQSVVPSSQDQGAGDPMPSFGLYGHTRAHTHMMEGIKIK